MYEVNSFFFMQERFTLRTRGGFMSFEYDERIRPILERFRLHHVASLGSMRIDVDLITSAVERWRRETHSFNMAFGEMSITLEDVSCLWGLPVTGRPVIGPTDDNWHNDVVHSFGRGEFDYHAYRRPPGTYHLTWDWLREPWQEPRLGPNDNRRLMARLPPNADEAEIGRYELF